MIHWLALPLLTLLVMFSQKYHLSKPGVTNVMHAGMRSPVRQSQHVQSFCQEVSDRKTQ